MVIDSEIDPEFFSQYIEYHIAKIRESKFAKEKNKILKQARKKFPNDRIRRSEWINEQLEELEDRFSPIDEKDHDGAIRQLKAWKLLEILHYWKDRSLHRVMRRSLKEEEEELEEDERIDRVKQPLREKMREALKDRLDEKLEPEEEPELFDRIRKHIESRFEKDMDDWWRGRIVHETIQEIEGIVYKIRHFFKQELTAYNKSYSKKKKWLRELKEEYPREVFEIIDNLYRIGIRATHDKKYEGPIIALPSYQTGKVTRHLLGICLKDYRIIKGPIGNNKTKKILRLFLDYQVFDSLKIKTARRPSEVLILGYWHTIGDRKRFVFGLIKKRKKNLLKVFNSLLPTHHL